MFAVIHSLTRSINFRNMLCGVILALTLITPQMANAVWTSSIQGTVTEIRFFTPDAAAAQTVVFALSSMPTTGCSNNSWFAFSPANVTDPQVLKNFIAMLLSAKASGQQVVVGYDSGASCDPIGAPRIYELMVL